MLSKSGINFKVYRFDFYDFFILKSHNGLWGRIRVDCFKKSGQNCVGDEF
jgi:hypothetical protein